MKKFIASLLLAALWLYAGAQVRDYNVSAYDSSSRGYYFLSCLKLGIKTETQDHLILDSKGDVVYYKPYIFSGPTYDFKIQSNHYMSFFYNDRFYIIDSMFHLVDSVSCKGYSTDEHEFQIMKNGHFLLLGYENVTIDLRQYKVFFGNGTAGSQFAKVKSAIIQEQDQNHKVVFEWHAKDYLAFGGVDPYWLYSPGSVDWTHSNALEEDYDGNILMSIRHFNQIVKINRSDSTVMWRFGGKDNQFNISGDTFTFYGQHDIRRLANGHITFFDNGNHTIPHGARGVEYALDEVNKTAKLVWSHMYDSAMFSQATGSVQRLPNGNTIIDYGLINRNDICFEEVDSTGKQIIEIDFYGNLSSYRAYKYEKLPFKLNRPAIHVVDSNGTKYMVAEEFYTSYLWSNGKTDRAIPIIEAMDYYVDVPYGIGFIRSEKISIRHVSDAGIISIPYPAKTICPGPQLVMATIKNTGLDTLRSAVVKWSVNGVRQTDYQFRGKIIRDSIVWLPIGTFNFSTGVSTIKVWCEQPNGNSDTFPKNDSIVITVNVLKSPPAYVGSPQSICPGYIAQIGGSPLAGNSYYWSSYPEGFFSKTSSVTVSPEKTTTYILTEFDGVTSCSHTDSVTISVFQKPEEPSVSGALNVCGGATSIYKPDFKVFGMSYSYHIDNASPSTVKNKITSADNLYLNWANQADTVTLWLVATNGNGCKDSTSIDITITPVLPASFVADEVCLGSATHFTGSDSSITKSFWEFGDGQTSTQTNPIHTYSQAGTYNVSLKTVNHNGCSSLFSGDIKVNTLPKAAFSTANQQYCTGEEISFDNQSIDGKSFIWDFGDGDSSTDFEPVHKYNLEGNYQVTLTVENTSGCIAATSFGINISPMPEVSFSTNKANYCIGEIVPFGNNTKNGKSFTWDFGDGTKVKSISPVHSYKSSGQYEVTLAVVGAGGCQSLYSANVNIEPAPNAMFNAQPDSIQNVVYSANDQSYTDYEWNFGDGKTGKGPSATHFYDSGGIYSVSLIVTNINGCTGSFASDVTVKDRSGSIGVVNVQFMPGITVYPNPFTDGFKLRISNITSKEFNVSIIDMTGKTLYDQSLKTNGRKEEDFTVNGDFLSPGIYRLSIRNQQINITRPLIKL